MSNNNNSHPLPTKITDEEYKELSQLYNNWIDKYQEEQFARGQFQGFKRGLLLNKYGLNPGDYTIRAGTGEIREIKW